MWMRTVVASLSSATAPAGRRRPRYGLLLAVVVGHLLALAGLVRTFAPEMTARVLEDAGSLVTVTVATPPPPPPAPTRTPQPEPRPDAGAAAPPGPKAIPREVAAPAAPLPRPNPAPRVASTGAANQAGVAAAGSGTGAVGE